MSDLSHFSRARNMFEPIEGRTDAVRNTEAGFEVSIRSWVDHTKAVTVRLPGGRELSLSIGIEPKFPDRPFVLNDRTNPTIFVLMGSLDGIAREYSNSVNKNTEFVYSVLQALSALNRISPFSRNPFFYSDRDKYVGEKISSISFYRQKKK